MSVTACCRQHGDTIVSAVPQSAFGGMMVPEDIGSMFRIGDWCEWRPWHGSRYPRRVTCVVPLYAGLHIPTYRGAADRINGQREPSHSRPVFPLAIVSRRSECTPLAHRLGLTADRNSRKVSSDRKSML